MSEDMLLLFKRRTLMVDDLIKQNVEFKRREETKANKGHAQTQTEEGQTKATSVQTPPEWESKPAPDPPKRIVRKVQNLGLQGQTKATSGFIPFFGPKRNFTGSKKVAFVQKGGLDSGAKHDLKAGWPLLQGHKPPALVVEHDYVIEHASKASTSVKKRPDLSCYKKPDTTKKAKDAKAKSQGTKRKSIPANLFSASESSDECMSPIKAKKVKKASEGQPSTAGLEELIPLGKDFSPLVPSTERAAQFRMTPAAAKAIAARKVAANSKASDKAKTFCVLREEKRGKKPLKEPPKPLGVEEKSSLRRNEGQSKRIEAKVDKVEEQKKYMERPMTACGTENIDQRPHEKAAEEEIGMDVGEEDREIPDKVLEGQYKIQEKVGESQEEVSEGQDKVSEGKEKDSEGQENDSEGQAKDSRPDKARSGQTMVNEGQCQGHKAKKVSAAAARIKAASNTFLESMLEDFKAESSRKQSERATKRNLEKDHYENDLNNNVVLSQLGRLWSLSTTKADLQSITKILAGDPAKARVYRRLVVQHLYVSVRDERPWEQVQELSYNKDQPLLTFKQAKVTCLLLHLEQSSNEFRGITKDLALFVRYSLLSKDRMYQFRIFQLANLARIYLALLRYHGDEDNARTFIYDVLFFKNARSHILLTVLLDTWPSILTWPGNKGCRRELDPVLETVIWMIYNTGPSTSKADMKVFEVHNKLNKLCGFRRPDYSGIDLVKHVIALTKERHEDHDFRLASTKSLLLLARWQEYRWANNNIVSRLLDVLSSSWSGSDGQSKNLLAWVIDTIGNVSRVYPAEGRDHLLKMFEPITTIVQTAGVTADLEDVCVRAILWTGHHLQVQVAKFFSSWSPAFKLSKETQDLVRNFVGTRGRKYGEKTVYVTKKKRIYNT